MTESSTNQIPLPARIGLLGCGAVSHQYLPNLLRLPALRVAAVSDVDADAAAKVAEQYDVPAVSVNALLADPEIDLAVNLTPISYHAAVTRDALNAGKHVYSEKSLATTVGEAKELLALARSNELVIGGAPDTLLGTAFQAARRELSDGGLGRPLTAVATMLRNRVPRSAYFSDHQALFDMAPYYISALVTLFGPVREVSGYLEYDRVEAAESPVAVGVSGVLRFDSGVTSSLVLNWNSAYRSEIPVLDVYTESGVLRCANPNNFGDPAFVRDHDDPAGQWREIPGSRQPADHPRNLRGLGVAEMAEALAAGRPPRASGELACHVVDVIESLVNAAQAGSSVTLTSTCHQPEPLSDDERKHLDPGTPA
ncbi:Gfo/Idh/MocA family protein [Microlunatus sp. Gsoil 973]|jgi:predicted dehydrogenase|uniref:Gfo/Idh/MocA family protein n=1 Tax=Microlunatus sp. Gsoil 973 TaxID=2672569 RepID=UPI0012B4B8C6|nr:Gfo/Idh/MocA family oxidoreductase [Microlunatus sp. Gsoil 973]QGN33758.1 gfo/Idh/MocA family oxidoreductase [Microlunatus sp. Gsoil 973]